MPFIAPHFIKLFKIMHYMGNGLKMLLSEPFLIAFVLDSKYVSLQISFKMSEKFGDLWVGHKRTTQTEGQTHLN